MKIELAKTDFGSLTENVPRLKVSNMYIVQNPQSLSNVSYIARPSLSLLTTIPTGPTRGIWFQSQGGTTIIYVIGGTNLYTYNNGTYTLIGEIPGTSFCTFASTIYGIAIQSDGLLYLYDGETITNVPIPDDNKVSDVTSLDNYFIVGIENTSKFYWILPGGTTINPLNFASAERNPDDIVTMISIGDELWSIGQSTVEIFTDSGDVTAPFIRTPQRVYTTGCIDKHSIVKTVYQYPSTVNQDALLPCLIWVTPSKEVVLAQGTPRKISNESIEELLKASSTFTAWSFRTNRHDFYVLNTDTVTVVYDLTSEAWYRWNSYQQTTWKALSGVQINDSTYCVDGTSGNIYSLSYSPVDLTSDYLICEVGGFVGNTTNGGIPCKSVTLFINYGYNSSYTNIDPVIEMRWSDSGGASYSNYVQGSLGKKGSYASTVRFRSLGNYQRPGRFFEFRFSEIQTFRLDAAITNDTP
jgi:hypothetical protein